MRIVYLFLLIYLFSSCSEKTCTTLPDKFRTYKEAVDKISKATYKVSESVSTIESSWIRSAKYLSCNGHTGYLIIGTRDRDYIHKDVPITLWTSFLKAKSHGSFYNENFKYKYQLILER